MNSLLKIHKCKYCNNTFITGRELGSHILHCTNNPNREKIQLKAAKSRSEHYGPHLVKLVCEVCGNEYELNISDKTYNLKQYKRCCSSKCSHKLSSQNRNNKEINKKKSISLQKTYKDKLKIHICEICGKEYTKKDHNSYKYCSDECSKIGKSNKCAVSAKKRGFGGFVENSINACYQGKYKGIKCDSSWELAFILWNELHNNKIERYKGYLIYTYKDKVLKYYPDFIVNNKDIYEIKGYYSEQAKAKHEQHPEVILLMRENMISILKEVEENFGKDFIKLYDKKVGS